MKFEAQITPIENIEIGWDGLNPETVAMLDSMSGDIHRPDITEPGEHQLSEQTSFDAGEHPYDGAEADADANEEPEFQTLLECTPDRARIVFPVSDKTWGDDGLFTMERFVDCTVDLDASHLSDSTSDRVAMIEPFVRARGMEMPTDSEGILRLLHDMTVFNDPNSGPGSHLDLPTLFQLFPDSIQSLADPDGAPINEEDLTLRVDDPLGTQCKLQSAVQDKRFDDPVVVSIVTIQTLAGDSALGERVRNYIETNTDMTCDDLRTRAIHDVENAMRTEEELKELKQRKHAEQLETGEDEERSTLEAWHRRSSQMAQVIVTTAELRVEEMNEDARRHAETLRKTFGYQPPNLTGPPENEMVIEMNRSRSAELTEQVYSLRAERVHVEGDQIIAAAGLMYGYQWMMEDVARIREEVAKADMHGLSPEQIVFVLAAELEIQTRPQQEHTEEQEQGTLVGTVQAREGTENTPENHMLSLAQQLHEKNLYFANHGEQKGGHGDAYHGVYTYVTDADGNQHVVLDTCGSCTDHQDLGVENVAEQMESQAAEVREQRILEHEQRQQELQQQEAARADDTRQENWQDTPPVVPVVVTPDGGGGGDYQPPDPDPDIEHQSGPDGGIDPYYLYEVYPYGYYQRDDDLLRGRSGGEQRSEQIPPRQDVRVQRKNIPQGRTTDQPPRSSGSDGRGGGNGSRGEPETAMKISPGGGGVALLAGAAAARARGRRAGRGGGAPTQRQDELARRISDEPVLNGDDVVTPSRETVIGAGSSVVAKRGGVTDEERFVAVVGEPAPVLGPSGGENMTPPEPQTPRYPYLPIQVISPEGNISTFTPSQSQNREMRAPVQKEPDIGAVIAWAIAGGSVARSSSSPEDVIVDSDSAHSASSSDGSRAGQKVRVSEMRPRGRKVAADPDIDGSPVASADQGDEPVREELMVQDEPESLYALSPAEPDEPAEGSMAVKLEPEATKRPLVIGEGDDGGNGIVLEAPATAEAQQLTINNSGNGNGGMARTAPAAEAVKTMRVGDTGSDGGSGMEQRVPDEPKRIELGGSSPDGSGGMAMQNRTPLQQIGINGSPEGDPEGGMARPVSENRRMTVGAGGGTGDGNGAMAKTRQRTSMTVGPKDGSEGGGGARAQQRGESQVDTMTAGDGSGSGEGLVVTPSKTQARNQQSGTVPRKQATIGVKNGEGGQGGGVESSELGVKSSRGEESKVQGRREEVRSKETEERRQEKVVEESKVESSQAAAEKEGETRHASANVVGETIEKRQAQDKSGEPQRVTSPRFQSTSSARQVQKMTERGESPASQTVSGEQGMAEEATASQGASITQEAGTYERAAEGVQTSSQRQRLSRAARRAASNAQSASSSDGQTDDSAQGQSGAGSSPDLQTEEPKQQKVGLTQKKTEWTTPVEQKVKSVLKKSRTGKAAEAKQLEVRSTPNVLDMKLPAQIAAKELGFTGKIRMMQPPLNKHILEPDMNAFRRVLQNMGEFSQGHVIMVGWKVVGKFAVPILTIARDAREARSHLRADRRRAVPLTEMKRSRRLAQAA